MQLVDNLIIILLVVGSFIAGMTIANRYNRAAIRDTRDALERQFIRLKAGADADDPVKPYTAAGYEFTPLQPVPTGDYDGDPPPVVNTEFMDRLKTNGRAAVKFNRADLAK